MSSPVAITDGRTTTLALLVTMCGFDFSMLAEADKRLHWKKLHQVLIQWMLETNSARFTANRLGFMGYNVACFTAQRFALTFPDIMVPLAPPDAPVLPPNPSAAVIATHKELMTTFEAFVTARDHLKFAFQHFFKDAIAHLAHEFTGFSGVTASVMFDTAYAVHGRMIPSDLEVLRQATRAGVDYTKSPHENTALWLSRHRILEDQGPGEGIGASEKMYHLLGFISSMGPVAKSILDKYLAESDPAVRTVQTIVQAFHLGLSRLPEQPNLQTVRRAYVAQSLQPDLDLPCVSDDADDVIAGSANAAAVKPKLPRKASKIKGSAQLTPAQLAKFYDDSREGEYCFHHGWGHHPTASCRHKALTPAQKALPPQLPAKGQPPAVDGVVPSILVKPGYRYPF